MALKKRKKKERLRKGEKDLKKATKAFKKKPGGKGGKDLLERNLKGEENPKKTKTFFCGKGSFKKENSVSGNKNLGPKKREKLKTLSIFPFSLFFSPWGSVDCLSKKT